MGLRDLFLFNYEAYQRKVSSSSYSSRRLERNINKKRRQCISAASAIPTGLGLAVITFGATAVASLIAMRNFSIAQAKLHILEKEWRRRGKSGFKSAWVKDRIMPCVVGAATLGLGSLFHEGLTSERDLTVRTSRRDYDYRRSRSRTPETSARRKLLYESSDGRRVRAVYPSSKSSSRRSSSRSGGRSSSRSRHHRESSRHRTHYIDVPRDHRKPSIRRASSSRVSFPHDEEPRRDFPPPFTRTSSTRLPFSPLDEQQYRPQAPNPNMTFDSLGQRFEPPVHHPVQYPEIRHNPPGVQNSDVEQRINGGGVPAFGFGAGQQQQQWTGPSVPHPPLPTQPSNNFMQQTNQSAPFNNGYYQQ